MATRTAGPDSLTQGAEDALLRWVEWLRRRLRHEIAMVPTGEPADVAPRVEKLRRRFGLSDLDLAILWCLAAVEVDPTLLALVRDFRRDEERHGQIDCELLVSLLADSVVDQLALRRCLAPGAPLFRGGLLRFQRQEEERRRSAWPLRLAPSVLQVLAGDVATEDPLGELAGWIAPPLAPEEPILPAGLREQAEALAHAHVAAASWARGPEQRALVLLLIGPAGSGKTLLGKALAQSLQLPLLHVVTERVVDAPRPRGHLADMFLEARLHDGVVLFEEAAPLLDGPSRADFLAELERFCGVVILTSRREDLGSEAVQEFVTWIGQLGAPSAAAREAIWRSQLGRPGHAGVDPRISLATLAGRFELSGRGIRCAVTLAYNRAVARSPEAPEIQQEDLQLGALAQLRGDTSPFCRPARADLSLKDLILPQDVMERTVELLQACRQHDNLLFEVGMARRLPTLRGIVALLAGEPGTGKSLCAEVLAAELGHPLHRVHLPAVVSRYVGETEKNINRMFEIARARNAILLFEEADSLFSSRIKKVDSANDRFANMEVNQLLQEMERHEGVVLLTTNLASGLDHALARRILFRIEFPRPEAAERARLWRRLVPGELVDPRHPVRYQELARRFDLAGGDIRNAVVRACYRALAEGRQLGHELLCWATMMEQESRGRLVYLPSWVDQEPAARRRRGDRGSP